MNDFAHNHGGNLRLAGERYARTSWLDFSANINPLGLPEPVRKVLIQALHAGRLEHYPDPDSAGLCQAFANRHRLSPEQVLPANGASEALQLALSVLPRGDVAIPVPCFSEYSAAARLQGHAVHLLPMEAPVFAVPLPTRRYRGVVLGHPNNPTSRLMDRVCLMSWLEACDWVVVDEAFLGLTLAGETASVVPLLAQAPNLIVLRALTKELAMPGLRLGYALGGAQWVSRMKERQIPWSVNALAQSVAEAVPDLDDYLARTAEWLAVEPAWLYDRLAQLGLQAWKPDTNFILCQAGCSAAEMIRHVAEQGILIRDASNFDGLDERYFRVAVRLRPDNERLLAALTEAL